MPKTFLILAKLAKFWQIWSHWFSSAKFKNEINSFFLERERVMPIKRSFSFGIETILKLCWNKTTTITTKKKKEPTNDDGNGTTMASRFFSLEYKTCARQNKPWSSGFGRRLMSLTSWVQIPALDGHKPYLGTRAVS